MLDRALLDSREDRSVRGRGKTLPVAIALHAAVIAAFVGAAVWNTGEPPEPVIPIIFVLPAAPPPPIGTAGSRSETHHIHGQPPPPSAIAPVALSINPVVPTTLAVDPGAPDVDLVSDDDPPGDRDGLPGGTGTQPGTGSGPAAAGEPLRPGGDVKAPVVVSRVEPDYPESMRRGHIEGVVILEAIITTDGGVDEVRVLKSASPLLDHSAVEAVRQWRYRPATLNGRAVRVVLTVTVTFGLKS